MSKYIRDFATDGISLSLVTGSLFGTAISSINNNYLHLSLLPCILLVALFTLPVIYFIDPLISHIIVTIYDDMTNDKHKPVWAPKPRK